MYCHLAWAREYLARVLASSSNSFKRAPEKREFPSQDPMTALLSPWNSTQEGRYNGKILMVSLTATEAAAASAACEYVKSGRGTERVCGEGSVRETEGQERPADGQRNRGTMIEGEGVRE